MEKNRHVHLRHAQHARDLGVRVAFKKSEREDLGGPGVQGSHCAPETILQFPLIVGTGRRFAERHGPGFLPAANDVERCVDGSAAQIALRFVQWFSRRVATKQAKEYRLQHVLGVGGIAGHPVRRPEDQSMTFLENPFDLGRDRSYVFLSDREFQGAPPVFAPLKTGIEVGYYKLTGKLFSEGQHTVTECKRGMKISRHDT